MAPQRSLLSLILALVATIFMLWGTPTIAMAAPTYTTVQIERIQEYLPNILALRDRMSGELQQLIQLQDWVGIGQFIHGPLGELRLDMSYVSRNLQPKDRKVALQTTRDLFTHLVSVDKAAQDRNPQKAASNYKAVLNDIDSFLQLLPS